MRRTLLILAVLAAPVLADANGDLLARADRAFAAADYAQAVALYDKLDADALAPQQKSAMQERRRFAQKQVAAPSTAPAVDDAAAAGVAPATQPTAAGSRTPHARPKNGEAYVTTLHGLGNFDYNEDDDKTIPDDVRKLDGAKVRIDGVMLPLDQAGRVTRFILVNDMMSCCYGQAPKLQNVAMVELPKEKWMAATTDRLSIEGILHVRVKREDGFVSSIFDIEPTSIKLAAE